MNKHFNNSLAYVWFILTVSTLLSWWIGRGDGNVYQVSGVVSAGVLTIAAIKALLVICFFMEVRHGPVWLKVVGYGWVAGMLLLLLAIYWFSVAAKQPASFNSFHTFCINC